MKVNLEYSVLVGGLARAVGIVFAYGTIAKMANLNAVTDVFKSYGLLPAPMIPFAVFTLILGQAGIAISHLGLVALPWASPLTAALLSLFLGFSIYSVHRGDDNRCLCFGAKEKDPIDGLTIARVSTLLAAETIVLIAVLQTSALFQPSAGLATTAISLAVALVFISITSWVLTVPALIAWWQLRPTNLHPRTSTVSNLPVRTEDPLISQTESPPPACSRRD
jgi:hypothetical protein